MRCYVCGATTGIMHRWYSKKLQEWRIACRDAGPCSWRALQISMLPPQARR